MAHIFNFSFTNPFFFYCIISHDCIIQLVESYRAILEQAQSITGVAYLPSVNGNGNSNASGGGRPTSASSVHRGAAGQGVLTQEVMDGMLQNATYGMQMLDVALRAKTLQGPGPPTSQHYPQHHQPQQQHPSQPPQQQNSTSSLTTSSSQVQPTSSTTSVTAAAGGGPSSGGPPYGYNTNSHSHPQQNSSSNSSSPRNMKDGGGGGGSVKGVADDGGRKVKSEGSVDKGVPANGTSASSTTTITATTTALSSTAGAIGAGAGSTAPISGDRSKRQVG